MNASLGYKIITKFCKKTDSNYLLFKALLERMPQEILATNSKNDFAKAQKLNIRIKNNIALLNYKWLFYNENWVWHLTFDIDKKFSFKEIIKFLNERFDLTPTWLCHTDKGLQFSFMLINVLKSEKQIQLASEAKKIITQELNKNFDKVDYTASNRIKGFWRNPLMHEYLYTGHFIELKTLKLKVLIPNTPKPTKFTKTNKKTKINFPKPRVSYQSNEIILNYYDGTYKVIKLNTGIIFYDKNFSVGNRNEAIFFNLLANTDSANFDEVFALGEYFNSLCDEPLEIKELKKIVNSVLNYNKKGKNNFYKKFSREQRILSVRTYKKNWEIGKMNFEKIKNLPYDEYLKEVKRRQSEAGKTIGKQNLIKHYNKKQGEKTKTKVYKAIKELKEKGEKVTILKIVELAKVSKNSASKYIKQAREEGII